MGDLEVYLHNPKNEVTNEFRYTIAADIAEGLQFLHSQAPPIVHRDLKSPNVLVRNTRERANELENLKQKHKQKKQKQKIQKQKQKKEKRSESFPLLTVVFIPFS